METCRNLKSPTTETQDRAPLPPQVTTIVRLRGMLWTNSNRCSSTKPRSHGVAQLSLGDHVTFDLRECYLDGTIGRTLLRVGKQQYCVGEG